MTHNRADGMCTKDRSDCSGYWEFRKSEGGCSYHEKKTGKCNDPSTDYDRINPVCIMLSDCDLAIIDRHKSEGQDTRDFLQRLISENLRVMRDRTP
jgi:hypothetical protein